jgi:hypothetical protein
MISNFSFIVKVELGV